MSPQRRTALVSVGAACLLIAIKLVAGLASSSLGLLAEAAHSGTDLAAALLTFFAVSVAVRPADRGHPYGHAKAQNLAALGEAGFLVAVSVLIAGLAIARLAGVVEFEVEPTWWTFAAIALVLAIDASRTVVSSRTARAYDSEALRANALHFGSDFAGTLAVLAGLVAAALGFPAGDSFAALFVSVLVVLAAVRLGRRNVDVLMDRSPEEAARIARQAVTALEPPVELRRLRLRSGGGELFADVVIGVAPGAAVGQGHAAADRVEAALRDALPGIDAVIHVEPRGSEGDLRERVLAAAVTVSQVREVHNLVLLEVGEGIEVSLHLKLPGDLPLDRAHDIAEQVEQAILGEVAEVTSATDAPGAAQGGRVRGGDRGRRSRGRGGRPGGDRRRPARASLRENGRRRRGLPHARSRRRRVACTGACARERGRGARTRDGARRRRRGRAHRAVGHTRATRAWHVWR